MLVVLAAFASTETVEIQASDCGVSQVFGADVAIVGDTDGDGFDDLVVGAPYDTSARHGAVYLYPGGPSGTAGEVEYPGDTADSMHGWAVSSGGDIDGDGLADVVAGAYGARTVTVYSGGSSLTATSIQGDGSFGYAVGGGGDLDGDGLDDVLVADLYAASPDPYTGAVHVLLGGPELADAQTVVPSDAAQGHQFGRHLSGLADLDGDGYADAIAGVFNMRSFGGPGLGGWAYPLYGSSTGVDTSRLARLVPSAVTLADRFGRAVAVTEDMDGDGFPEAVVGAPHQNQVYVFGGGAGGLDAERYTVVSDPHSDSDSSHAFGASLGRGGDPDGDGLGFLVVGEDLWSDRGETDAVFEVAAETWALTEHNASDWVSGDQFGDAVSGGGDLDGDGRADVVAGAYNDGGCATYAGSVYLFLSTGGAGEDTGLSDDTGGPGDTGAGDTGAGDSGTTDSGTTDSGEPGDTALPDPEAGGAGGRDRGGTEEGPAMGCGCTSAPPGTGWGLGVAVLFAHGRRRRR